MAGQVTSQGDRAIGANVARKRFGINGAGIKIGIISDSFNVFGGAESDIAAGELPGKGNPNGLTQPVRVLKDALEPRINTDEGRAMAQIVHDVAPGAQILFHTSGDTEETFVQAVRALVKAGADVIVDDIGVPAFAFQDGILAQTVTEVVDQGVVYVSAAGNDGDRSYVSPFRSGTVFSYRGSTYEAHDFDPGEGIDVFQDIEMPRQRQLDLVLEWDQPVGQVANDVELFLLRRPRLPNVGDPGIKSATILTAGANTPQRNLVYQARSKQTVYLVIARKVTPDSPIPDRIQWRNWANGGDSGVKYQYVNAPSVNPPSSQAAATGSTLFGHPNARGAIAVGAANYTTTPAFQGTQVELEDFSSSGGIPILFDAQGNRLPTPEIRQKPEIVGPDGVTTTVVDPISSLDRQPDPLLFDPFFGTSAAAPHVAAVAALMLQRAGGRRSLTPAQTLAAMQTTAIPMDPPGNFKSGAGFIQADRAVLQSYTSRIQGTAKSDRLRGMRASENLWGKAGHDTLHGGGGLDALFGGTGRDTLHGDDNNDYLLGEAGNDRLVGGDGNDFLAGGTGGDILQGGKGKNQMVGGRGKDRFVLEQTGFAVIDDFQPRQDHLELSGALKFSDLTFIQQQHHTLIQRQGQSIAQLIGIEATTLTIKDFLL